MRARIALNILIDESAISAMAEALEVLRANDDPMVPEVEHIIRSHRVGIIKQRAIMGAFGLYV